MPDQSIGYYLTKFFEFLQQAFIFVVSSTTGFYIFLSIVSIFFLFIMAYCGVRLIEIRKKEHEHLHHEIIEYAHHHAEQEKATAQKNNMSDNEQWGNVLQYVFSGNPSDWKLAIIEADNMLDKLMDHLGIKGENLGEKLKNADKDKFRNISAAWEVHIIRNKIAHESGEFELSQHEAKRVIALYEQIFREFGYI